MQTSGEKFILKSDYTILLQGAWELDAELSNNSQVKTSELKPGVHNQRRNKPKKRKKKRRLRPKKQLEGIYRKTSNGLTPPSYFCSGFTAICGLICMISGLTMTIMGHAIPAYQVNTPAGNFMRVGGGFFVVIGFVMMMAGLFYFLLVYFRHRGMFNRKDENKPPPPKDSEKGESESETDDEKQKGIVVPPVKAGMSNGVINQAPSGGKIPKQHSQNDVTTKASQSVNARKKYTVANENELQKETYFSYNSKQQNMPKSKAGSGTQLSQTSDEGITFTAGSNPFSSTHTLPGVSSEVNILQGKDKIPSRLTQRRQSVAVGVGIHQIEEQEVHSSDVFGNSNNKALKRNTSASDLPKQATSPRHHKDPPSFFPLNKLPPINSLAEETGDNHHREVVTQSSKLDNIISDVPPSTTDRLNTRRGSLLHIPSSPLLTASNNQPNGDRLNTRRGSLLQVPSSPVPVSTPKSKMLKKTKSSMDIPGPRSNLHEVPRTPLTGRESSGRPSILERRDSMNMYVRNSYSSSNA